MIICECRPKFGGILCIYEENLVLITQIWNWVISFGTVCPDLFLAANHYDTYNLSGGYNVHCT